MTKEKAKCKICGCTDERGCIVEGKGGEDIIKTCHWVYPDICSACMIPGRKIRIKHVFYLGRWFEVGTEGVIKADISDISYETTDLYRVEIAGQFYALAPADFEVTE